MTDIQEIVRRGSFLIGMVGRPARRCCCIGVRSSGRAGCSRLGLTPEVGGEGECVTES